MNKPVKDINCAWIRDAKETDYIVVSSRVRLARNLADYVFPLYMTMSDSANVVNKMKTIIEDQSDLSDYPLTELNNVTRSVLVEKHLISPHFASLKNREASVLINNKGSISIMVNEEDHLRLQCILPGLNLEGCYREITKVDEKFEAQLNYAYDSQLGYLTSCPTNLGTGMRASVMLHLPALVKTKNIAKAFDTVSKFGLLLEVFMVRVLRGRGICIKLVIK
jgi:protein arginine kinase